MENTGTMENLKLIENDLVPVYTTDTGEKVVYGTELHKALGVKSNYRDWAKNRLYDCDAVENMDFEAAKILAPSGQSRNEHIIKLDIAKEMAMLERNERGKQVRRYFIRIEEKYRQQEIDLSRLSPQLQLFNSLFQSLAEQELRQMEQEEKMAKLDNKLDSIKEVISLNTRDWRKDSGRIISKIALKAGGFQYIKQFREESYKILEMRMGVSLGIRLMNKKKNMALNGAGKAKIDELNQLDVIADDRKLVTGYLSIIKEMAIKYGIADEAG